MQTVSETFAGTITVNRQMRLALPRMAMSLLIMSYLVEKQVLSNDMAPDTAFPREEYTLDEPEIFIGWPGNSKKLTAFIDMAGIYDVVFQL